MTEFFKLVPIEPTTNCKIAIVAERKQDHIIPLSVLGWIKVLPNRASVPVANLEPGTYQCSALDAYCTIQATIQYKINDRFIKKTLTSNPVNLTKQLKQRTLYLIQATECKLSIDELSIKARIVVENKKIKLSGDNNSKFQLPLNEKTVEVQPYNFLVKINFATYLNQFLRFFSQNLKWTTKFRSSFCVCMFNSKIDQDLFLFSVAESFKQNISNISQIKIVGTVTPRNDKDLKNDGSASSLTSNNKSRGKNKQKVRITECINLKRSHTKMSSNKQISKHKECLDIFDEEEDFNNNKGTEQSSILKNSDASMDLRGSFQELERNNTTNNEDDDKLSNHSFRQKEGKVKLVSIQQQNVRLRNENIKLKQQVQTMSTFKKQLTTMKKKYENAVQELKRLEGERISIVKDKMKFQSAYYQERQEKDKLKKELEALKANFNYNGIRHNRP